MKMLRAFLLTLILTGCAVAQTETKCFQNAGLKDNHSVSFKIEGAKVSGVFAIERGYDASATEVYEFSGTRAANLLTIRFANNKAPAELPPNMKSFVWTLVKSGDNELLKIKIHGKNYETGRYSTYTADYESCEPGRVALTRSATRVQFASGATNATMQVSLTNKSDRKAFLLNMRKGQQPSVEAHGCGISFYYPDGSRYEEGTAIDVLSSGALPQSGDYLFVISPAGEPGQCSVTFTVNSK